MIFSGSVRLTWFFPLQIMFSFMYPEVPKTILSMAFRDDDPKLMHFPCYFWDAEPQRTRLD